MVGELDDDQDVFVWDTSASVGPYLPIIYSALSRFAEDVTPDVEEVNLLPFGDGFLLPHPSSRSEDLIRRLNDYDRSASSSSGEEALKRASEMLARRDGKRAIVFVTDAVLVTDHAMWPPFREARAQVFSLQIGDAGFHPAWSQDLMQDYAYAFGGHASYAGRLSELEVGFERSSAWLRRPSPYRVKVVSAYREPPGPGTLRVLPGKAAARPAVEVILDASGSMGAVLPDGTPRIDAARATLRELVSEIVPEGSSFALRAFGHVSPSSCEQRLEVPLGPLDRAAALAAVDAIQPKLLSQTPIADALLAARDDLAGLAAPAALILISDGEESCGGDPEAALDELRAAGIQVTLSIVSLGLNDAGAAARFAALAEAGGGTFVDVEGVDALSDAVAAALVLPFEVLRPGGEVPGDTEVEVRLDGQ